MFLVAFVLVVPNLEKDSCIREIENQQFNDGKEDIQREDGEGSRFCEVSKYSGLSNAMRVPNTAPLLSSTLYRGEHRSFRAYLNSHCMGCMIA